MAGLLLLLAVVVADAPKQGPVEHLHSRVVEAIRNCPESGPGEITICARDRGIAEGWRLPKLDPRYAGGAAGGGGRGSAAAAGLGAAGTGSCSAAGAGGITGCQLQLDKDWGAWKQQQQADGRAFPW